MGKQIANTNYTLQTLRLILIKPDSLSDCIVSDVVSVWDAKQFPKRSHLRSWISFFDYHNHYLGIIKKLINN